MYAYWHYSDLILYVKGEIWLGSRGCKNRRIKFNDERSDRRQFQNHTFKNVPVSSIFSPGLGRRSSRIYFDGLKVRVDPDGISYRVAFSRYTDTRKDWIPFTRFFPFVHRYAVSFLFIRWNIFHWLDDTNAIVNRDGRKSFRVPDIWPKSKIFGRCAFLRPRSSVNVSGGIPKNFIVI